MTGQRGHRERRTAHRRLQQQAVGCIADALDQIQNVSPHAAAQIMRQHQDCRPPRASKQLQRHREAIRPYGITHDVLCNDPRVAWIAMLQHRHSLSCSSRRAGTEADRSLMVYESVAGEQMPPATRRRAKAEVVLFAVAPAERFGIEQARLCQCRAADIHAEPDAGRQFHTAPGIRRTTRGIQFGHAETECRRACLVARITADRRVIGEWRHGGDARLRIGMAGEPCQPTRRHFRVAVQQHDVVGCCGQHADVYRGDKASVPLVADQQDTMLRGLGIQPGRQPRFGRAIIYRNNSTRRAIRIRQH